MVKDLDLCQSILELKSCTGIIHVYYSFRRIIDNLIHNLFLNFFLIQVPKVSVGSV